MATMQVAQSVGMQSLCYLCISRQVTPTCEVHLSHQKRFTDAQQGLEGRGADPEGPFAQACQLLYQSLYEALAAAAQSRQPLKSHHPHPLALQGVNSRHSLQSHAFQLPGRFCHGADFFAATRLAHLSQQAALISRKAFLLHHDRHCTYLSIIWQQQLCLWLL